MYYLPECRFVVRAPTVTSAICCLDLQASPDQNVHSLASSIVLRTGSLLAFMRRQGLVEVPRALVVAVLVEVCRFP
jgi:hypothetical protein